MLRELEWLPRAFPQGVESWLSTAGDVVREFPGHDSECTSVAVERDGERWFVKWSTHAEGMTSLRRAINLHTSVRHSGLIPLQDAVDAGKTVVLVYPFVEGRALRPEMGDTEADFVRTLPLPDRGRIVESLFDVHVHLADAGFIAVDLYDGCIMYDTNKRRAWVYDIDEYRFGPFVLDADRLLGSRRFMAPEEFLRGSRIDQITNVFTLARLALVLMGDRSGSAAGWLGSSERLAVLSRATSIDRAQRYPTVHAFVSAYRGAGAAPGG